jgi:hypothetical protein
MKTYIALFRVINVGGNNVLPMMDRWLGKFIEKMHKLRVMKRTLLVVVSAAATAWESTATRASPRTPSTPN